MTKQPAESPGTTLSIFETTARLLEAPDLKAGMAPEGAKLLASIRDLLRGLESGQHDSVEQALLSLGARKETDLFQRVGQMARNLHTSLNDFKLSLDSRNVTMNTTTIPDAANKLEAVITMTTQAAHTTLSLTEQQAELIDRNHERLSEISAFLHSAPMDAEIKERLYTFLERQQDDFENLKQMNGDVLMAQSFQDLSGQALRKVIKLVTELESSLVSLIQLFGQGPAQSQAESAPETSTPEEGLEQGDVDSILSSFGF